MPEGQASVRKLTALEKQQKALALKASGMTYEQIAERVGYRNRSGAYKAVMKALNARADEIGQAGQAMRALQVERLERLTAGLTPAALGGVRRVPYQEKVPVVTEDGQLREEEVTRMGEVYVPPDPESARVLIRTLDQLNRLQGLYPPNALEVSGPGGLPIEVEHSGPSPKEVFLAKVRELAERKRDQPELPAHVSGLTEPQPQTPPEVSAPG